MDSYAWIEFFIGSKKGEKVLEILSSADEVITPALVLAELARKYIREGVDENTLKDRLKFVEENSIIICIDRELSIQGAKAYVELLDKAKREGKNKPGITDSILLALSRKYNAKVITGDEIGEGMKEVIFL
ncbi:type II toxin-antitoxin system VapC family toxin [Sulfolobus sp. S-194]|uniref:PIN domain-containing protein n=1 Tax=Sulfolobus sp. S-194 TaxID=2512240 RepID=UPI001437262A|nr:PIN domain-containing protein [Sulfolobus sp. S-194]QIW24417.1 type II toxin-antitoxin system VapC family toxin [Sulfolobus sp. S-194]